MEFDGARMTLSSKNFTKKELPDYLVRPPINEEKLMKIREREKMRLQN